MDEDMKYEYGRIEISDQVRRMLDTTIKEAYAPLLRESLTNPGLTGAMLTTPPPMSRRERLRRRVTGYRHRLRDAWQVLRYGAWLGDGWE